MRPETWRRIDGEVSDWMDNGSAIGFSDEGGEIAISDRMDEGGERADA